MDCLWIFSFLLVKFVGAGTFLNNPRTVEVPQAHAVDYTIWNQIQASCDVTRTIVTGQSCLHNGFTYLCRNTTSAVTVTTSCNRCEIINNPHDMFYEKDMSIVKKSCSSAECSGTCPVVGCLSVGVTVSVGVRCWNTEAPLNTTVTTTVNITTVSNSSFTNCPALTVSSGILSSADSRHCNTVKVTCIDGYRLNGNSSVTCCDGAWLPALPTCTKDCNVFTVANGTKSTNDIGHGTRVTVICSEGYSLSGPPIVTCSHGVWLDNIPTCHKDCEIISILNGSLITNHPAHRTQAIVICEDGYSLVGPEVLTCQDGNWSPETPVCMKDCKLPSVPNAKLYVDHLTHGSQLQVNCNLGYTLTGSSVLTCENGVWSGYYPACLISTECSNNTYGKNCTFKCNCNVTNTVNHQQSCDSSTGKCRCLPTWTGETCDSDVDECATGTHNCDLEESLCQNAPGGFGCMSKTVIPLNQNGDVDDSFVLPLVVVLVVICVLSAILLASVYWRQSIKNCLRKKLELVYYVDPDALQECRSRNPSQASADSGYGEKGSTNKGVIFHEPNNSVTMHCQDMSWEGDDLSYL